MSFETADHIIIISMSIIMDSRSNQVVRSVLLWGGRTSVVKFPLVLLVHFGPIKRPATISVVYLSTDRRSVVFLEAYSFVHEFQMWVSIKCVRLVRRKAVHRIIIVSPLMSFGRRTLG